MAAPTATTRPGGVEKQRRAGKYTHPFGGMRQFAEDRARNSGWDRDCLQHTNTDVRRTERGKVSDRLSEIYKEAFISVNMDEGKGRPKANNISAAKKTVKMIAERVLLSLEARATQVMFKEVLEIREQTEKELMRLRQIDECGNENPKLTYDEIRAIAREKLSAREKAKGGDLGMLGDLNNDGTPPESEGVVEQDEEAVEIEMMKQAIVEMRAEEASKGFTPAPLDQRWVEKVTAACQKLVQESYSHQYVPHTRVMGCRHFYRKNRILMTCCGTFPVCRMCHFQDPNRIHDIKIEPVSTMLCMLCGEVQPKAQYCRKCKVCFGQYYCDVCGITDDTPEYDLRHCPKCNVCMPGLTFHCDLCKSCVPAGHEHYPVLHNVMPAPTSPPVVSMPGVSFDPAAEGITAVDAHQSRRS